MVVHNEEQLSDWHPAYLKRTSDGLFEIVVANSPVDKSSWQEFLSRIAAINDMRPFVIDFFCVKDALERVRGINSDISTSMSEGAVAVLTPGLSGIRNMAHAQLEIANYLNTAWSFREHSLVRFVDKYGKDSAEVQDLKSIFSKLYDRSLPYRLLYDLRNYAQHYDMPVSSINNKGEQDITDNRMRIDCKVMLSVSELVNNPRVKTRMKNDLTSMGVDHLDIVEVCVGSYRDFCVIMDHVINKYKRKIVEYHAFYLYVFQNLKAPEGATVIFIEKGSDRIETGEKTNVCHTAFDELQNIICMIKEFSESGTSAEDFHRITNGKI